MINAQINVRLGLTPQGLSNSPGPDPLEPNLRRKTPLEENTWRKNVKLEKSRHWNLLESCRFCCRPQLYSLHHQRWPHWAVWTRHPWCLQIQETGEWLRKICFLNREKEPHIDNGVKMSHLSSLKVCFDHKKSVVVEVSNHGLQDGCWNTYPGQEPCEPDCPQ